MRAYLTRKDINNPAGQDQNARPTYKDAPTPEDDEVILQTMAEAAAKYSEHDRELRDLVEKLGDYNEALTQKAEIDSRKKSNVPSAMTLPNRIHDLTTADLYNANGDYRAEIEAGDTSAKSRVRGISTTFTMLFVHSHQGQKVS